MDLAKAEDKAINVLQGVGEGFLVMLRPNNLNFYRRRPLPSNDEVCLCKSGG